jgi:calcineurin-like phosphoesterase family protein
MNIFFTSDLHLDHGNIIKYCNRPFTDPISMTEQLILNWNEQVGEKDLVFVLGDFLWNKNEERLISCTQRLNGRKVLIRGNHDGFTDEQYLNAGFEKVTNLAEIKIKDIIFVLCHYQMAYWNESHYGSIHLYGHQHDKKQYAPNHIAYQQLGMSERKMNVCMDSNNYHLYSLEDILEKLKDRPTNWWGKR